MPSVFVYHVQQATQFTLTKRLVVSCEEFAVALIKPISLESSSDVQFCYLFRLRLILVSWKAELLLCFIFQEMFGLVVKIIFYNDTYLYSLYKRVPPPPPTGDVALVSKCE